jgi:extradiol dioxygenase family protein
MNHFTTQLYRAWRQAVTAGEVANRFRAPQDDPAGRWHQGEHVMLGIRSVGDEFAFYAHNLDQSQDIHSAVEEKFVGDSPYICQFNGYRSLRPGLKRVQPGRQPTLSAAPADCRFYCQTADQPLSLVGRRPLMQVQLDHYVWQVYYNAAPIEKNGHFLWVPVQVEAEQVTLPHFPQVLTLEFLQDAIALFQKLDQTIVFFNGLNAGASVNHIHLQAVHHHQPLALATTPLKPLAHCTILQDYLAPGLVFDLNQPARDIFRWVAKLQRYGIPYNLVMIRDGLKTGPGGHRIVLFPRDIDHEITSELPNDRPGAPAFWGKLITTNRQMFCDIDLSRLTRAFQKMGLSPECFAELLKG